MSEIPERRRAKCDGCGATIDSEQTGNAQWVAGWAVNRPKGTNAIVGQERAGRYLCRHCLDNLKHGIAYQQAALF